MGMIKTSVKPSTPRRVGVSLYLVVDLGIVVVPGVWRRRASPSFQPVGDLSSSMTSCNYRLSRGSSAGVAP